MDKEKNIAIILCFIIGIILMSLGVFQIIKTHSYSKTTGEFTYSEEPKKESNPNYYIWHYKFTVNNTTYFTKSKTEFVRKPASNKITIYYDSTNPEKNRLANDYTSYYLIIIGLIFSSVICFYSKTKVEEENEETNARNDAKKMGWFILLFIGGFFFIILSEYEFRITAMLLSMFIPTILLIAFLMIGVKLLINAYNPNHIFKYEYKDGTKAVIDSSDNNMSNDELASRVNDVLSSEETKNKVFFIKGIIQIAIGSFICFIYSIPALMVLLDMLCKINGSYKIDGKEVTAIQFLKYTTLGFGLFFLIPGIILIVSGIKKINNKRL